MNAWASAFFVDTGNVCEPRDWSRGASSPLGPAWLAA